MYKAIALISYIYSKIFRRNYLSCFIRCGGVNVKGLTIDAVPRKKDSSVPVLEKYIFVPNITELDIHESVRVNVQIIFENTLIYKYKVVEIIDEFTPKDNMLLIPIIKVVSEDQPLVQQDFKILSKYSVRADVVVEEGKLETENGCLLVIASNASRRKGVSKFLPKKYFFAFVVIE